MTNLRPSARIRTTRSVSSNPTEIPMTTHLPADQIPAASTIRDDSANDHPIRSTAMQLLHEDLARAQIRERVRKAKRERQVAQLARARRLSRKEQSVGFRARLLRARFD